MVARGFYALSDTLTPVLAGGLQIAVMWALSLWFRDALFPAVGWRPLGGLALAEKNPGAAIPHYQKAMALNPGYFGSWLGGGVAQLQGGNKAKAEEWLNRSVELLPTAPAAYYLGNIARDRGDGEPETEARQRAPQHRSPLSHRDRQHAPTLRRRAPGVNDVERPTTRRIGDQPFRTPGQERRTSGQAPDPPAPDNAVVVASPRRWRRGRMHIPTPATPTSRSLR